MTKTLAQSSRNMMPEENLFSFPKGKHSLRKVVTLLARANVLSTVVVVENCIFLLPLFRCLVRGGCANLCHHGMTDRRLVFCICVWKFNVETESKKKLSSSPIQQTCCMSIRSASSLERVKVISCLGRCRGRISVPGLGLLMNRIRSSGRFVKNTTPHLCSCKMMDRRMGLFGLLSTVCCSRNNEYIARNLRMVIIVSLSVSLALKCVKFFWNYNFNNVLFFKTVLG